MFGARLALKAERLERKEERLEARAAVALATGHPARAARLQNKADRVALKHDIVQARRLRRALWGGRPFLRIMAVNRAAVRRRAHIQLINMQIYEAMIIADAAGNLKVADEDSDAAPCQTHTIVMLPELVEVNFTGQNGAVTTVFADSHCSRCGQHFFISPHSIPGVVETPSNCPPQPAPPVYYPPPSSSTQQQQQQQQPYYPPTTAPPPYSQQAPNYNYPAYPSYPPPNNYPTYPSYPSYK